MYPCIQSKWCAFLNRRMYRLTLPVLGWIFNSHDSQPVFDQIGIIEVGPSYLESYKKSIVGLSVGVYIYVCVYMIPSALISVIYCYFFYLSGTLVKRDFYLLFLYPSPYFKFAFLLSSSFGLASLVHQLSVSSLRVVLIVKPFHLISVAFFYSFIISVLTLQQVPGLF